MKGMKNYKRKQITNVYPLPMHMLEQLKDMGTVIKETNINIPAINNGQLMWWGPKRKRLNPHLAGLGTNASIASWRWRVEFFRWKPKQCQDQYLFNCFSIFLKCWILICTYLILRLFKFLTQLLCAIATHVGNIPYSWTINALL